MPETVDQRVACRVCGRPLDDGSPTCPACDRSQARTRSALGTTALLAAVLIFLALVLAVVESASP